MKNQITQEILEYNHSKEPEDMAICELLAREITRHLPEAENKVWHRHPVWFLEFSRKPWNTAFRLLELWQDNVATPANDSWNRL